MSRIRTVKPDFWTSEDVMSLPRDARLLFIGIWNFADDYGRLKWAPRTIKAQIFPGDSDLDTGDVENLMLVLVNAGLLERYGRPHESSGGLKKTQDGYAVVTGWHHQKVNHPTPSKLPPPNGFLPSDASETSAPHESSGGLKKPLESSRALTPDPLGSSRIHLEERATVVAPTSKPPADQTAKSPTRFRQLLDSAVRSEFFRRGKTPQKAGDAQWRDGCQTVQDALQLGLFEDAEDAAAAFAKQLVDACTRSEKPEKLGFALQQTTLSKPAPNPLGFAVTLTREGF